jgi:spermidine/putrescine transport system permease protein
MKDRKHIFYTVGPAFSFLVIFFVFPLLIMLVYSFLTRGTYGGIEYTVTLENYRNIFDPLYLKILFRSLKLASLTTVFSLLIGYPAALAISQIKGRRQFLFLMLVMIPSWMNLLIKNYAWIVLFRRQGLINSWLMSMGIINEPLALLFTEGAVLAGLVHSFLPFMILPVFAVLERLDYRLVDAARDLGANRWQTFWHIILPQSAGGIWVGSILVFVPALGAFLTPDLLGGANSVMIGNVIQNQIYTVRDWPFGSALAIFLMAIVLAALLIYMRFTGRVGEERTV